MKKCILCFVLFVGIFFSLKSQGLTLTDSSQLSLLTCSPGPAVYEKFGHSAIRILDTGQGVDLVANWGIFDFDDPGFYFKFVKGDTWYSLAVYETHHFVEGYKRRNVRVTEQVLNFTQDEKEKLFQAILINNQPENRKYLYNYVFDNCATRVRDIVNAAVKPKIVSDKQHVEKKTFREWVAGYTGKKSWVQFGIDLIFGKDADEIATAEEAMFLPEVVCGAYESASIIQNDSIRVPLVAEKHILLEKSEPDPEPLLLNIPLITTVLLLFIGLIITLLEHKNKKRMRWFDFSLFIITGIGGIIIFYLMFFSIHPLVKNNFNLLWCNPLNLIIAVLIVIKKGKNIVNWYAFLYTILILVVFFAMALGVQEFNVAFLPLMALMLFRAVSRIVLSQAQK
ncbi:MAG: DUF4105 domain-containing protein [Paludibacteraceae bacterium]